MAGDLAAIVFAGLGLYFTVWGMATIIHNVVVKIVQERPIWSSLPLGIDGLLMAALGIVLLFGPGKIVGVIGWMRTAGTRSEPELAQDRPSG